MNTDVGISLIVHIHTGRDRKLEQFVKKRKENKRTGAKNKKKKTQISEYTQDS